MIVWFVIVCTFSDHGGGCTAPIQTKNLRECHFIGKQYQSLDGSYRRSYYRCMGLSR